MEVRKKVEIMSGPVRKNKFNTGKNTHLLPNTYIFFFFYEIESSVIPQL